MAFNWLYTSWNDNEYILFLIIVILFFIIVDFKLIKRKSPFDDIPTTTQYNTTTIPNITTIPATTLPATTIPATTIPTTTQYNTTTIPNITTIPATTQYQAPTETNPANNLFISDEEKAKWRKAWVQLDGNEETIPYSFNVKNDILQLDSSLYTPNYPSSNISANYAQAGSWATLDDLGKTMTDTLGGINSNLGYTILTEQQGTFTPNYSNPNVYDNTQSYKTGLNSSTLSGANLNSQGVSGNYKQVGKSPIFMQKDFAGVANIFAPNIYVNNTPLNDNGMPDISFSNGDSSVYTV
jgi:hypothetical protein